MKKLIYYKSRIFGNEDKTKFPGLEKFLYFFKIYPHDVTLVDRSNTFQIPVNMESLSPIPKFTEFKKTYEEICNDRAKELWRKVDEIGGKLYIFYSGGIDSTLLTISFLKNATEIQKQKMVILLTEDSISENPNFYKDHIEGKIAVESTLNYPHLLGTNNFFVTGEHNDQIFGADVIGMFMIFAGQDEVKKPYDKKVLVDFYNTKENNPIMNTFYVDLFDRLCKNAPVKIVTYHDFFWWINFTLKWQSVYMRVLAFTAKTNVSKITKEYLEKHYTTFYGTDEFQLWSMNNMDKKMKDTWKTYKWPAKEIIFAYNGDRDYFENKAKVGSLQRVVTNNESGFFIDDNFKFTQEINFDEYYNKDNDFV